VITQTIGQADYVLLGFATNPGQVGLYYFAFRLAVQPVNILAGNINGVLFPLLSQHRQQPERQKAIMLKALNTLNMVIIPICMLQAAIAPPLVPLVFGAKWAPAVGMLIVLTLGISVEAAAWQAGALLNSRGQFGKTFKYTVAISPLFFIFIGVGLWLGGAIGVACGVALYYFVFSSSFTYLAMRRDGVTARQVMVIYLKPAAMGAIAMGGGYLVGELPKIVEFPILRAGVTGLVGCVAYLTLWRMFGRDSYTTVVDWAVGRVVRLLRRSPPATVSD
jgi:O-antigen/teichoic acid export membrane protein